MQQEQATECYLLSMRAVSNMCNDNYDLIDKLVGFDQSQPSWKFMTLKCGISEGIDFITLMPQQWMEYKQSNQVAPEIRLDIVLNQGMLTVDKTPIRITFINASIKSECVVLVSKYQVLSRLLKSVCPYQDTSYEYWIKNGVVAKKLVSTGNISVKDAGLVDGSVIELTVNKLVIKNFDRALEQSLMSHQENDISTPSTDMDYSFRCNNVPQHFQLTPDLMQHYDRHFEMCKKNSRDPAIDLDYKALKYVFKELVKLRTVISKDLKPRKSSTEQLN